MMPERAPICILNWRVEKRAIGKGMWPVVQMVKISFFPKVHHQTCSAVLPTDFSSFGFAFINNFKLHLKFTAVNKRVFFLSLLVFVFQS